MADKMNTKERRAFRLSALEIFLLVVAIIGLAFMVKTIVQPNPYRSSARSDIRITRLEQRINELENVLRQRNESSKAEQSGTEQSLNELENRIKELADRVTGLEKGNLDLRKQFEAQWGRLEKTIRERGDALEKLIHDSASENRAEKPTPESKNLENPGERNPFTYTVSKGDTGLGIAQKFGVTYRELCLWNRLDPEKPLKTGWKLIVSNPNIKK